MNNNINNINNITTTTAICYFQKGNIFAEKHFVEFFKKFFSNIFSFNETNFKEAWENFEYKVSIDSETMKVGTNLLWSKGKKTFFVVNLSLSNKKMFFYHFLSNQLIVLISTNSYYPLDILSSEILGQRCLRKA